MVAVCIVQYKMSFSVVILFLFSYSIKSSISMVVHSISLNKLFNMLWSVFNMIGHISSIEPTTPVIQAYVCVHLTNVLIDNVSLKRTIYCYIWGIIFTCSTYYRVMLLFVNVFHIIAFDLYLEKKHFDMFVLPLV